MSVSPATLPLKGKPLTTDFVSSIASAVQESTLHQSKLDGAAILAITIAERQEAALQTQLAAVLCKLDAQSEQMIGMSKQLTAQAEHITKLEKELTILSDQTAATQHYLESTRTMIAANFKEQQASHTLTQTKVAEVSAKVSRSVVYSTAPSRPVAAKPLVGKAPPSPTTARIIPAGTTDLPANSVYPRFSGTELTDPLDWMEIVERLRVKHRIPDDVLCSKMPIMLTGQAAAWYKSIAKEHSNLTTWADWRLELLHRYDRPETWQAWRREELDRMSEINHDDLPSWVDGFTKLHQRVHKSNDHQTVCALVDLVYAQPSRYGTQPNVRTLLLERVDWTLAEFIPKFCETVEKWHLESNE